MLKDEFPIMAYLGVHSWPNQEENYRQFADCGFNLSMWRFGRLDTNDHQSLREACQMADKCGVGIIACCEDLYNTPAEFAKQVKDLPGFYGYYIVDEPTMSDFQKFLTTTIRPIQEVDTDHMVYCNAHPCFSKYTLKRLEANTHEEYLDMFKHIKNSPLSFDFYPIRKKKFNKKLWYNNLRAVKKAAEEQGKEFWAFILSVPHAEYPQPTIEHFRIQAYTNLAFGAQGIEYFTYQTPVNDPDFYFHDGPIEKDGITKTRTWDLVKEFNQELKLIAPVFHHGHDFKVEESKCGVFFEYIDKKALPKGITRIRTSGDGVLMSTFKNGNSEYMVLVNQSYKKDITIKIKLESGYSPMCLKGRCVGNNEYYLSKGNCLIFKL